MFSTLIGWLQAIFGIISRIFQIILIFSPISMVFGYLDDIQGNLFYWYVSGVGDIAVIYSFSTLLFLAFGGKIKGINAKKGEESLDDIGSGH